MRSMLPRLCLSLLLCLLPLPAMAQCCLKVAFQITPNESNQTLTFRLTNNEPTTLNVKRNALPWGSRYSLILVAAHEEQPNRQISQQFSIDESTEELVELKASAAVVQTVKLQDYFANLPGELQKGALILFWSYQLTAADGRTSERHAGSTRLTQQK